MPEPLKNLYNQTLINNLCVELQEHFAEFDSEGFTQQVFDEDWGSKELKARMAHITVSLQQFLPQDYAEALGILKLVSSQFEGFEFMFFPGFVESYGIDDYELSIDALAHFTAYASSEFAVRPFIKRYPDKMMQQMTRWADSENHHVRRLASEGCRPRLPWAMALPEFKKDPEPVLDILEKLKNDESEYVRRSVANNLNDISKDNPEITIRLAEKWLGQSAETDWVVKHACRSLLKQGLPEVMRLFGFVEPINFGVTQFTVSPQAKIGGDLEFSFLLNSKREQPGKLRIDYAIDFLRKNGRHSRKVFKLSESDVNTTKRQFQKRHSFKLITTRTYYPGLQRLSIICNGVEMACKDFDLE